MAFFFGNKTTTATAPTSTFGFGAKTTASGFGGFGNTSTTSTGFSFGAKTTASTGFSFGTPAATASSGFSFGAPAKTTASLFSGFGATTSATTSGFGGFGSTTSGFGGFGTTSTSSSGFGTGGGLFSGFGAKTTATTGFSLSNPTQAWNTGQQQQQQQQQHIENPLATMTTALTMPTLFGDERDGIIAKLNQLQALWGHGKAFYSQNAQPIPLSPENPFSRFKTIGYSCLPSAKDSDGFVAIELIHDVPTVKQKQKDFVKALTKVLGNKPSLSVCVDGLRVLPGNKSEAIIYVVERQDNGLSKRVTATELYAYFSQDAQRKQLNDIGVANIYAKTTLSESQVQQFLETPPLGIDSILWEQAKKDNPDPKNLIPVPMMGFTELLNRLKHQEYQNTQQSRRLELISEELTKLQTAQSTTLAKLAQYKRKHLELAHRVLEVMINLETSRKTGYAIEPEEEQLRIQFESIQAELNAPMQFKSRLNELMSQIRLQSQVKSGSNRTAYTLDDQTKYELKQHLSKQQDALLQLVSIINEDFEDLKTVENGLTERMYIPR